MNYIQLEASPIDVYVKAESLGPERSMIGYKTKKKEQTKNI